MNTEAETLETRRQHIDAALARSEGEASPQSWSRLARRVEEPKPTHKKHEITCAPKLDPTAGSWQSRLGKQVTPMRLKNFLIVVGRRRRSLRNYFIKG